MATVGFRSHSGWAAAVALDGPREAPVVVGRWRVALVDDSLPRQVFHAAKSLPLPQAEALVERVTAAAARTTQEAVERIAAELAGRGCQLVALGVALGTPRQPSTVARILASHASMHAAEGDLYRDAVLEAAERLDLAAAGVVERDAFEVAAGRFGTTAEALRRRVTELGRPLGAPWGSDQKMAALVAWLAAAD
jgi:hypothetical protein